MTDASRDADAREQARRQHAEAVSQLNLLLDTSDDHQSDFNSYRYFASEGFLPGYQLPSPPPALGLSARAPTAPTA